MRARGLVCLFVSLVAVAVALPLPASAGGGTGFFTDIECDEAMGNTVFTFTLTNLQPDGDVTVGRVELRGVFAGSATSFAPPTITPGESAVAMLAVPGTTTGSGALLVEYVWGDDLFGSQFAEFELFGDCEAPPVVDPCESLGTDCPTTTTEPETAPAVAARPRFTG